MQFFSTFPKSAALLRFSLYSLDTIQVRLLQVSTRTITSHNPALAAAAAAASSKRHSQKPPNRNKRICM